MVSNRLKGIITTAALGLGGLAGSAYAQESQAFTPGSMEDRLIQQVRADVARESDYKWGYRIEIFEEPCEPLLGNDYLTACVGTPKTFDVCVFNEEWANAPDPVNASSKGMCSTVYMRDDGTLEWFRLDGDKNTRSCMWGVDSAQDLEFMELYSKSEPNGGVNNIRGNNPGAKQSDATTIAGAGLTLQEPRTCEPKSEFERAMRSIRFSYFAQSDPRTISFNRSSNFNPANHGAMDHTKWVYKIQPDGNNNNGPAQYIGKALLQTRRGLQDGNVVNKYEKAVLRWLDVDSAAAANWPTYTGLLRWRNELGIWGKQDIDNRGWAQGGLMNPREVDYQDTDEANDGPCGHPDQYNDWGLCPTGAPFRTCTQNGVVSYQEKFDARVNPGNVAHGLARVQQLSDESALLWYFTPSNNETNMKVIDGSSVNDHYWGYASSLTNVLEERIFSNELTGAQKVIPGNLGQIAQPYHDVELFPKNP